VAEHEHEIPWKETLWQDDAGFTEVVTSRVGLNDYITRVVSKKTGRTIDRVKTEFKFGFPLDDAFTQHERILQQWIGRPAIKPKETRSGMKCPSVDRLMAPPFELQRGMAKLVRDLCNARDNAEKLDQLINMERPNGEQVLPATARYLRSLHSSPYNSKLWRTTMVLHAINEIVGGHGVEGLGPPRSGDYAPPYEYINFGDPYVTTLIYNRTGRADTLSIGDWGSIAERHPNW
jgi:hypothetical protein